MTEREWFRCEDATEMISFLANSGSILNGYDRKIQLFSVACVHRVADRLPNDLCRQFLEAMDTTSCPTGKRTSDKSPSVMTGDWYAPNALYSSGGP